ncbi:hypothetical protein CEP52_016363 [Fusarium oligoseptatum]|uniref:Uncharacterized protein n=1 Tax=Fusarium oligoseptatum TaxID=2604345 RepID=A0A428S4E9_9HYPO|nr:hypothetical protein CEP52_016363 [Fusarium oligoseptatum]
MGVLDRIRGRSSEPTDNPGGLDETAHTDKGADQGGVLNSAPSSSDLSLEEKNEKEIIENPTNITADAPTVYITYAWIWVCFFMLALQQSILNNVTFYAYSDFAQAPQIATAQILASIIGGVLKLPIAKILNLWGRAEGFLISIGVYLLGMVIIASCKGPDGYAAGYVLYWIGYYAIYFIMDVFVADTSGLRNRAFAFAFVSTPFICTAFTGPLAAQSFIKNASWRWAVGAFLHHHDLCLCPPGYRLQVLPDQGREDGPVC